MNEVLELLKKIKLGYNRFEVNEEVAKFWYEFLAEAPYEEVKCRLMKHVRESRYEPTISDLLPDMEDDKKRQHVKAMMEAQKKTYPPREEIWSS